MTAIEHGPDDPVAVAMLRWIHDHAAEGIFTTDADLRIRTWNQWLTAATGIGAESAVGRPLFDVVPSLEQRGFGRYYTEALRGEANVLSYALHRFIVPGASGPAEQSPQSGRVAPLHHEGGIVGTITVIHDVSERVAAERELRAQIATAEAARATAEKASRVKDEFLATLSHEIRTPLNAVLGWTRILRSREPDPAMTARAIDVIDRNATAQLTLITDMLDMARITAGKARMDLADVDIVTTIHAAMDVVRPAADAKGIALSCAACAEGAVVRGDADRLLQVFWNLLSNAVKFTDAGGTIAITVARANGYTQVEVKDTGQGISAEFLPHVFERFKQADTSAARRHGGLGLGLALVREIVHLHGGSIQVASDGPGAGSTFTVILPVLAAAVVRGSPGHGGRPAVLAGVRILIVEDDPDAREIVSTTVSDAGASVTAVGSAAEALGSLRDGRAEPPDVVIADIGLPGEDGYTFIRALRDMPPDSGGLTPVIAVTAYATAADRQHALAAGFYEHLPKPFVPETLLSTITRASKHASGGPAGSVSPLP